MDDKKPDFDVGPILQTLELLKSKLPEPPPPPENPEGEEDDD